MSKWIRAEQLWQDFQENRGMLSDDQIGELIDFAQPIASQAIGEWAKRSGQAQIPEGGED